MNLWDFFRPKQKDLLDLHPELEGRVSILRVNSEEQQSAPASSTSYAQAGATYNSYVWLQKAVNKIADNLAPLPLVVARGSGADTEYLDNHPVMALLDSPNPEQGSAELTREWVIGMFLGGEIGFEVVRSRGGKIIELWPRSADTVIVRPENVRYRRVAYYKIDDGAGEPYLLTPDEFIHFKFFNPLQPFRGLTPVAAVKYSIVIDQLAQAWSRLFFRNSARPDYAIIAPEGITKTEKEEMLKQLEINHSGGDGVHKPIILENGVTDIKTFNFAPKDMEWLNQREMSRDEVAAIVGVPDEIMGYGRDTYENFATAERVLWTLTIIPLAGLRDSTLTRYMRRVGMLGAGERVVTDTRNVPQLQEDKTAKITNAHVLFSMGVPVNTVSEYLNMGLPSVPGGDVGFLPMGLTPVDDVINPPENTPALAPEPEPTPEVILPVEDETEEDMPEIEEPEPPAKAVRKAIAEYGSEAHAAEYKRLQARLDKPVDKLQRAVKREFQRQQNEIGAALRAGKIYGRGLYKAGDDVPSPESLFNAVEEVRKFIAAFESIIREAVQEIGDAELAGLGIRGVFDIDRPQVRASLREILETVSRKVNDTTFAGLKDLFEEAERLGEGIPAIQERLATYFGDRKSDYQTERIARTTMTGASNSGTVEAWRQSEVVRGKTWISALQPDRTRDAHAAAHGQVVGLDELFVVDGESLAYPGDPQGSPENIISCLCGVTAEVEE